MTRTHDAPIRHPDIRAGTISNAAVAPAGHARVWIDFGPALGTRSAGVRLKMREHAADLVGARVCAVLDPMLENAPSCGALPLAMPDGNGDWVLIRPDLSVQDGARPY